MGVVGLVMAGGKGSRLDLSEEKPLIKLANVPVINYVLKALKEAKIKKYHDIIFLLKKKKKMGETILHLTLFDGVI